jgi:hypothetical protein
MTGARKLLRISFMPLIDAAALVVAVDGGFSRPTKVSISS